MVGYKSFKGVTGGFQKVTRSYTGLQWVTGG